MRLPVPTGFVDWWENAVPHQALSVVLGWRERDPKKGLKSQSLKIGVLDNGRLLLCFESPPDNWKTTGPERVGRLLSKAMTRAGWRRPSLDPAAFSRLIELRRGVGRLEFILDTNALVEGVGHWLVDHFADRCDLVITAVTLRELQDVQGSACFGKSLDTKEPERSKKLGARQLYLAANRLRERTGYRRVLWRELEVDDTALLLSRGGGQGKSSEADTLLLRAVRRSINDRVNGLERLFVSGDTALSRRAATELPVDSAIAAQVRDIDQGEVLFPCAWWPGVDQGLRIVRHPARLVWELLCIGDDVTLTHEDGRAWTFQAFGNPMWPSDYLAPWVDVTVTEPEPALRPDALIKMPDDVEDSLLPTTPRAKPEPQAIGPDDSSKSPRLLWSRVTEEQCVVEDNLRIPSKAALDLLAALACDPAELVRIPDSVFKTSETRSHLRRFLEGLQLASPSEDFTWARPLERRAALVDAWRVNDLDAVFDVVRGWSVLEEWATLSDPPHRPVRTQQAARALASLLGQGMFHPDTGQWVRGGLRPTGSEMRAAVREALPDEPHKAISIHQILTDVFLVRLGVSPARIARYWKALWEVGVFEGFEPREGGSSSGRRYQEIAELTPSGWRPQRLDLESLDGTRDLVFKGIP